MITDLPLNVWAVVVLALMYGYLNGILNSGSLVAAAVSSRSLRPRSALLLASVAGFLGPFVFGTSVAATIGRGLIDPGVVDLPLVASALVGAIGWSLASVALGFPTSASHALVGGLVGGAIAAGGTEAILPNGLALVLLGLVVGPILGLVGGFLILHLVLLGTRGAAPSVNMAFRRGQLGTLFVLALSQGTNDAQKGMAVVVLALIGGGAITTFEVPEWVVAASAAALALGVFTGGTRIIRRVGAGLYKIRPVHGFSAQGTAALAILGATFAGWPVSTGQVMSASVLGVGAAHRPSAVRWSVARTIVLAWLVTVPVSGFAAAGAYWLLSML